MSDEERSLLEERRAKLAAWRATGDAYPNDFRPDACAADLQAEFGDVERWTQEALDEAGRRVSVAGRMMAKRIMGKASFTRIQDHSGAGIQLFLARDELGPAYDAFKGFDVGDQIGIEGRLMRTRTGELSVRVEALRLLSKNLRPLPEKWHGLSDAETRYRQRYVDLIVTPESRAVFMARSRVVAAMRSFLEQRGFLEVETPMMQPIPGGATARPFVTHHNALDMPLYLRVAPELYLKRLVVGGLERVFEINRNFRNEGVSTRHNPEFTMMELYWSYVGYRELMDLTEDLVRHLRASTREAYADLNVGEHRIDLDAPFERVRMEDAVARANPQLPADALRDRARLAAHCVELKIPIKDSWGWGKLLTEIYERTVEPNLIQPTFVTDYPLEVSPLSRRKNGDPEITERFELMIGGRELANGFSELNDPEDQAQRFLEQVASKDAGDDEAMHFDADYIRALEVGMPPTGGLGLGVDRLVMLLTNSASIRDVLLFPAMRPET